ncbi:MAG: hypothetical protein ACOYVG_15030 [Bacteroidota bacterium]
MATHSGQIKCSRGGAISRNNILLCDKGIGGVLTLAEWQLEHTIEHSREKEFIKSMIEDAQIDTANINRVLKQNRKLLLYIDTLTKVCYNYEPAEKNDFNIYRLYREVASVTEAIKPTERTLTQLKNSGGMRLIRKKVVADILILYDGFGKDVVTQRAILDGLTMDNISSSYELFNFKFYNPGSYQGISQNPVLLTHNKEKIIQFANRIVTYGAGTFVFCQQLEKMNKEAVKLIEALRKEYHLTE